MPKTVSNWGNYPRVKAEEQSFSTQESLKQIIEENEKLTIRANGRSYGDASLGKRIISTLAYNQIISFDEETGVICCQSGLVFKQLLEVIIPKGWFLPVTPGTKFITVGGAVAADIHGKNHHVEGSFSNYVNKIELLLANGEIFTSSPIENTKLFEATLGGMGLTGVILSVTFQLKKIESTYIKQKKIKAKNLDHILSLLDEYKNQTYAVAWIDCLKKGNGFGRSVLILGEHASISNLPLSIQKKPLQLSNTRKINIPFYFPNFVLNSFSIRVFNFMYYHKNFRKEKEHLIHYESFFYPLDTLSNWNKMYGKSGFVQYQFVIPFEQGKEGLKKIMEKIIQKGFGSFLSVLKVLGRKQKGIMSFPLEGYTLALDFPISQKLFDFLDELDQIVIAYGGRLYLAKDARMPADVFWQSYPHSKEFLEIVKQHNPNFKFHSLQSERLIQALNLFQ